jgi:hypothetical protein
MIIHRHIKSEFDPFEIQLIKVNNNLSTRYRILQVFDSIMHNAIIELMLKTELISANGILSL